MFVHNKLPFYATSLFLILLIYFVCVHFVLNYFDLQLTRHPIITQFNQFQAYHLKFGSLGQESQVSSLSHQIDDRSEATSSKEEDIVEWMKKKEESYLETTKTIKKVCERYNKNNVTEVELDGQAMMVDTYFKFGYCPNAKVGSTTWMSHLMKIMKTKYRPKVELPPRSSGRVMMSNFFKIPSELTKTQGIILLELFENFLEDNQITTFSFVRHPFERLVSAFKDKRNVKGKNLTFPEFVHQVLEEKDMFQIFGKSSKPFKRLSMHWKPYSEHCHFCDIPYKVIGRTENFAEDVKYIILKNKLEKVLPIDVAGAAKNKAENKAENSDSIGKDPQTEALSYFSQINKNEVNKLYEKYRMDFEMFSYDASPYLQAQ